MVTQCPEDPTWDIPRQSWDVPQDWCDLASGGSQMGYPKTVLGRHSRVVQLGVRRIPNGTSQDSPGTSLKIGATWCPEDPKLDIPRQSWDVPQDWCDLVSGGSHMGHPKTVLGRPSRLVQLGVRRIPNGTSEDSPGTSLKIGATWCPDDPKWDIPGQSWDVPQDWCDLLSGGSQMGHPKTVLGRPSILV